MKEIILNNSIKNNPILLIMVIIVVFIIAGWIIPYLAGESLNNYEREEWARPWHMMGMGGMWMFPFFPIIVLVLILYFVFGQDQWRRSSSDVGDSALEILKKRYAKGEITKEEFEEMKKNLLS